MPTYLYGGGSSSSELFTSVDKKQIATENFTTTEDYLVVFLTECTKGGQGRWNIPSGITCVSDLQMEVWGTIGVNGNTRNYICFNVPSGTYFSFTRESGDGYVRRAWGIPANGKNLTISNK